MPVSRPDPADPDRAGPGPTSRADVTRPRPTQADLTGARPTGTGRPDRVDRLDRKDHFWSALTQLGQGSRKARTVGYRPFGQANLRNSVWPFE